MRTNLTFPTNSTDPSRREFCTASGTTVKSFLMKLWKRLCLNFFSQREWKCLADVIASCCMVNWGRTFSPLLVCYIQLWKLGDDLSEPDLFSIWLATTPTLVFELLIVHFTLVVLLSRMIITWNDWTCLLTFLWSSTIWKLSQGLSSFVPDKTSSFKKTFSTKLQFVGLLLQWIPNLHSLDLILKIHSGINNLIWIKILKRGQPIVDFDAADNCRLCYNERNELSRWYALNSNCYFERPLCTSVWFDFDRRCYWKLSLSRTSWRTTEAGGKLYLSSRAGYWTHCFGRTNVFGCDWQV